MAKSKGNKGKGKAVATEGGKGYRLVDEGIQASSMNVVMDNTTKLKSNLFQPSPKYCADPRPTT